MSEMTEGVARAICWHAIKLHVNDDGFVDRTGCPGDLRCKIVGHCCERRDMLRVTTYWQTARAAIAAMREPSTGMINAVEWRVNDDGTDAWPDPLTTWRAMIAAALADQ